jgi:hypothetical protein
LNLQIHIFLTLKINKHHEKSKIPGNAVVNYYNAAATHIFNNAGVYEVNVYCDQGENKGPQSFCKQIVVKELPFPI